MGCENRVSKFVPSGYSYKEIKCKCGTTGPRGELVICEECEQKAGATYPQGWRDVPGDTCPHGTYVGDAHGPDLLCPQCEDSTVY